MLMNISLQRDQVTQLYSEIRYLAKLIVTLNLETGFAENLSLVLQKVLKLYT